MTRCMPNGKTTQRRQSLPVRDGGRRSRRERDVSGVTRAVCVLACLVKYQSSCPQRYSVHVRYSIFAEELSKVEGSSSIARTGPAPAPQSGPSAITPHIVSAKLCLDVARLALYGRRQISPRLLHQGRDAHESRRYRGGKAEHVKIAMDWKPWTVRLDNRRDGTRI